MRALHSRSGHLQSIGISTRTNSLGPVTKTTLRRQAMPSQRDPAARLREILERNRQKIAPDLPRDLLVEIADIEEQNQFDDDRKKARQNVRDAVGYAAKSL